LASDFTCFDRCHRTVVCLSVMLVYMLSNGRR